MMRHHDLRSRAIRAWSLLLAAVFCYVLLTGTVTTSLAQDGGGTESVFRLGPTARGVSLGNAMVGMANDASAPYWNAALLPHAPEAQFAFSYNSLYSTADGATYQYLGMVYPTLRAGGFGIGFLRMAMGEVQTYDGSSRPTGNVEYAETQLMFSYGYGGRLPYLGGRMDLGLTAKIHSLELVERASSGGMDLALAYAPRFTRGLRFSYVFQNLVAPSFRLVEAEDTMPTAQRFAVHKLLRVGQGGVLELGVAYDSPQYASGRAGFGAEYRMQGLFVARMGLESGTMNFGLGGRWRAYAVDYAFRSGGELGASQFLSLSWFFGESLEGQRMRLAQAREQELEQARLEAVEEWRRDEAQAAVVQLRSALAVGDAQGAQQQLVRARALGADEQVLAPLQSQLQAEQDRQAREAVVTQVREIQVLEAENRLRAALAEGDVEEARSALAALRELVADHPMLSRFQQEYDQLWAGAVARGASQATQAEEQGDWVAALQAWERVAQLDPRNTGPADAQARWRAELDAARSDSDLARREAERARVQLEEEQRYAVALERFAQAEWDAAELLVMELLVLSPDHAGALELQSLLEARRQAPRALDPQEEEKVRGYYLAGLAHFSDGDYEAAILQWQRILGIDAENEGARNNIEEAQARLSRLRAAGATGSSGGRAVIGNRNKHAELRVEARESKLAEVRDFVGRICRYAGFDGPDVANFKLAVDEACTNIIQHSLQNQGGEIAVWVDYRSGRVEIRLRDQGSSFDFTEVKSPDLDHYVNIGKRGGLGIYLIKRIMDEVEYSREGEFNQLRLAMDRRPRMDRWIPGLQFSALHRSLRMRFTLRASFGLAVLVGVALGVVHFQQRHSIFEQEMQRLEGVARDLAVQSRSVLATSKPYSVERTLLQQSVLELARNDSTVAYARVVHEFDGTIWADSHLPMLFTTWQPEPGALLAERTGVGRWQKLQASAGTVFELAYPVRIADPRGGEVQLGLVVVALRASELSARYRSAFVHILGIGLLAQLVGSLLILVMVNLFVRPIQQLTEGVLAIGDGVLVKDIEVQGPDEISTIAAAFNEIAGKFRHAQSHLVEQERFQKEMQLAREIQHTLLPDKMPEISGYEISAMYRAAAEVGGDYYDFFTVDEDTTGIVVADVSGKGIPGSLVMTMIRTALRMEARGNHSASDVMSRVNTFITADMRRGMFITLFYVILDSKNRVVSYASAGHNPMLLYRKETDEAFFLNPPGFPVGISLPDPSLFERTIDVEKIQLQQDDLLLAYTDGVTEAMNAAREQYGEQRLIACVRANAGKSAEEFIEELNQDVARFTDGFPQNDDITVVAIKEKLRPATLEIDRRVQLLDMVDVQGMEIEEACQAYGVSVSTYYRWRRLREKGGEEALSGRSGKGGLRRLTVEEREALIDLVRTDPAMGAQRLASGLSRRGQEVSARMVYEELVRLDLSNEGKRRLYLRRRGWKLPDEGAHKPIAPPHSDLDQSLHFDSVPPESEEEPEEITVGPS